MTVENVIREIMANGAVIWEFYLLYGREPSNKELAEFRPRFEAYCALPLEPVKTCPMCGCACGGEP